MTDISEQDLIHELCYTKHIISMSFIFNIRVYSGICNKVKNHFTCNWWSKTVRKLHKRYYSWKSQYLQLLGFFRSFLFHCFPLRTSVKQTFGSFCDLLNSPFHQNETEDRATRRRSKVEVLDEMRDGSCINLAVTKPYKIIHSAQVRKNINNNKPQLNYTTPSSSPKILIYN